jgi:cation/acetate symporter
MLFLLPAMSGHTAVVKALAVAAVLSAALAAAGSILLALAHAAGHDLWGRLLNPGAPPSRRLAVARVAILLVGAGAVLAAATPRPAEIVSAVIGAYSLSAAGLFPALVLGIWWKRANAWGAVAGIVLGLGVGLYYLIATRFFPMEFHELWHAYIPAGEVALANFESARTAWESAEGDAKALAWTALQAEARGSPLTAGAASWLSIPAAAAAIVALPVGFLAVFVFSLVTPRPSSATTALVDEMRRPRGPQILHEAPLPDESR